MSAVCQIGFCRDALAGNRHAFDHDFSARGNFNVDGLALGQFHRRAAQAAGDVKLIDTERNPCLRANDDGRLDADGRGDFQAFVLFFRFQNHPPQMMIRRRPKRKPIFAENQHPVNRQVADAGVRIFADLHTDGDVRTDIFIGMCNNGQLR